MGNTVLDLFFVTLLKYPFFNHQQSQSDEPTDRIGITLRDTLGDHLLVALLVTSVPTIFALVPGSIEQELAAISAKHNLVKLLWDEFMAIHLVNFTSFSNGDLTRQTSVHGAFADIFLNYIMHQYPAL
jgi:hypothetical protein